jgi:uncharacterized protein YkwD
MRKPLGVVCGVAAAVLVVGGLAARTADAETTPDVPAVPGVVLPDMPEIPQLPADDTTGTQDGAAAQDPAAQDPAGQDPAGQDPGPGLADLAVPGFTNPQPAGDERPGDQNRPGQSTNDGADQNAQRPGGQAQPARARPAVQKPADSLAAAQQDVTPSSVSTDPSSPVQQQILTLVNQNRRGGGCGALSLDRRLIVAASGHAADMARRGYFAHESPNGEGAGDRVSESGYRWSRYGENIARGVDSAYAVVDGWMHSPEHRENIMDCRLQQMGIGLAFAGDRTPYWVQDFATPQ